MQQLTNHSGQNQYVCHMQLPSRPIQVSQQVQVALNQPTQQVVPTIRQEHIPTCGRQQSQEEASHLTRSRSLGQSQTNKNSEIRRRS